MPTGQTYIVQQGDCLSSIADSFDMLPKTVWDANSDLQQKRYNPNTLMPGDQLLIPAPRVQSSNGATDKLHRFVLKTVPTKFRLVIEQHQQPIAGKSYELTIDGKKLSGSTSDSGLIEVPLPASAKSGVLKIPDAEIECELQFGCLDPLEEVSGAQARLQNLGYYYGDIDGEPSDEWSESLSLFQSDYGLDVTGELDGPTQQKLLARHDKEHSNPTDAAPPAAAAGPSTADVPPDESDVPSEEDDDAVFQAWEESDDS
jgi:hypothetical protein